MKVTIDAAGRVVIPKTIRECARLGAGAELEIRIRDDIIELEPTPTEVHLRRKGEFLVAEPALAKGKLRHETVSETIRYLRSGR